MSEGTLSRVKVKDPPVASPRGTPDVSQIGEARERERQRPGLPRHPWVHEHTGQGLEVQEVFVGAMLKGDGAATLAAGELEGKGLALLDVEGGVEEGGLGDGQGGHG